MLVAVVLRPATPRKPATSQNRRSNARETSLPTVAAVSRFLQVQQEAPRASRGGHSNNNAHSTAELPSSDGHPQERAMSLHLVFVLATSKLRCCGYFRLRSSPTPAAWPLLPDTGASRKTPPFASTRSARLVCSRQPARGKISVKFLRDRAGEQGSQAWSK